MANLMAVLVARTAAARTTRFVSMASATTARLLTAYTSIATHGCVAKAMDLAGFGIDALRCVKADRLHRIDVAALRGPDRNRSRTPALKPFLVVGLGGERWTLVPSMISAR